jgi:ABC-type transport system involved in multi-copper enzyme maturation permease subunit
MVSCSDILEGDPSKLPEEITPELAEGLRAQCLRNAEQTREEMQTMYDGFTMHGGIAAGIGAGMSFGLVLLAVLTASMLGAEYGLGTLRLVLARGTGRWRYLTGKFVLLAAAAAGALLISVVVTLITSAIASALADSPPAGIVAETGWAGAGIAVGKAWTGMLPFLALVGLVATVVRSTAAGMAIGLGYLFAEQILVAIFSNLFDWFDTVSDYLLIQNISVWAANPEFRGGDENAAAVRTALLLIAYGAAFFAAAYWLFNRRDVAGASGG